MHWDATCKHITLFLFFQAIHFTYPFYTRTFRNVFRYKNTSFLDSTINSWVSIFIKVYYASSLFLVKISKNNFLSVSVILTLDGFSDISRTKQMHKQLICQSYKRKVSSTIYYISKEGCTWRAFGPICQQRSYI